MSPTLLILGLLAWPCLFLAAYLLLTSRRRVGAGPRCGRCGYNLTGAPSNRCPECGSLFVEAGVVVDRFARSRSRAWVGLLVLLVLLPPLTASFYFALRAEAHKRQALAVQRQLQAEQRLRAALKQAFEGQLNSERRLREIEARRLRLLTLPPTFRDLQRFGEDGTPPP